MSYSHTTYTFVQLEPIKGYDLMVTGECEVSYKQFPPEPDVGIMRDQFEFEIGRIWLHPTKAGDALLELTPDSYLHKVIYESLSYDRQEYIEEFLAEDSIPADY